MFKLMQSFLVLFCSYLTHRQVMPIGITFVDLSKLQVYYNLRILRHQVFKSTEKRGKETMGWYSGFKLHFIINDSSGIISVKVTTLKVDNRNPISEMADEFWGVYTETRE
uniref:transposase n=1 Tax=Candidatus Enterovibrio escicola TaxID=1927127 RepID=UPI001CC25AF0|nr:transposase [Candidatus Enterovibrio escacola]